MPPLAFGPSPEEMDHVFLGKTLVVLVCAGAALMSVACGDQSRNGFCGEFEAASTDFQARDASDPEVLRAHVGALAELNPPDEIAADWGFVVDSWEEFSGVVDADVDPADLDEAERFVQRSEEYRDALRSVRSYLRDECGFDMD